MIGRSASMAIIGFGGYIAVVIDLLFALPAAPEDGLEHSGDQTPDEG